MADIEHLNTPDQPTADLATVFAEMARALLSAGTVTDTLKAVVDTAVETIDGCDAAGVFLLAGGIVTTYVPTDPIVLRIDDAQRHTGEGPCLAALTEGATIYAGDLADDRRWAHFGPQAAQAGIRSALAVRLSTDGAHGTLNLYAHYPEAFGVLDRAKAVTLALLAGLAVASAQAHDEEGRRADHLEAGLVSRETIGQAEGILMERERVTAEEAFDILRRASQHLNVKLRDVAQRLVDTGERPDTGPPSTA